MACLARKRRAILATREDWKGGRIDTEVVRLRLITTFGVGLPAPQAVIDDGEALTLPEAEIVVAEQGLALCLYSVETLLRGLAGVCPDIGEGPDTIDREGDDLS
jgi:hypothetical protein